MANKDINRQKDINLRNVSEIQEEAKTALAEMVDEYKNAQKSRIDFNFSTERSRKIFDWYLIYKKNLKDLKKYHLIAFFVLIVFFSTAGANQFQFFEFKPLNQAFIGLGLFGLISFTNMYFFSEHNLELFFISLYRNIKREDNYEDLMIRIANAVFVNKIPKYNGLKFTVFCIIVLVVIYTIALSIIQFQQIEESVNLMFIAFFVFIFWAMVQKSENVILKFR